MKIKKAFATGCLLLVTSTSGFAQNFSANEVSEINQVEHEWATFPPVNDVACSQGKQFAAYSLQGMRSTLVQIRQHQERTVNFLAGLPDSENKRKQLESELELSDKWIHSSASMALSNVKQAKAKCLGISTPRSSVDQERMARLRQMQAAGQGN